MIFHWIITPLIAFMNGLYGLLPSWNVDLGQTWLPGALQWLSTLDKFMPLHDGVLPILTIAMAILVSLLAIKGVKWLLSLIPGISSAG